MELCLGGRRLAEGGLRYTSEGICIVVVRCCIIEASRYLIVIHPYAEGEGLVSCIPARAIFRSWCSYSLALCSLGVFFSCLLFRLFTAACFCFASCSEKTKVRLFWFVSVPFFFVLFFFPCIFFFIFSSKYTWYTWNMYRLFVWVLPCSDGFRFCGVRALYRATSCNAQVA